MTSRTAPKTAVSRAGTGARAAPGGKAGRAHAAKKNIDAHRRAPVDLGYATPEERGHARDGIGHDGHVAGRPHHQGGGAEARPAGAVKRRAMERRPAAPKRTPRRRRA